MGNDMTHKYFYSTSCGPCKMLHSITNDVAKAFKNFSKVNVSNDPDQANRYGIKTLPTMITVDSQDCVVNAAYGVNGILKRLHEISTKTTK